MGLLDEGTLDLTDYARFGRDLQTWVCGDRLSSPHF